MKTLLSSVVLILLLSISTSCFANEKPSKQKITKPYHSVKVESKKPLPVYFWILYGPCLQLGRLNDPGFTDSYGCYHEGPSLTFMGADNYVGTTQICPPTGQSYC